MPLHTIPSLESTFELTFPSPGSVTLTIDEEQETTLTEDQLHDLWQVLQHDGLALKLGDVYVSSPNGTKFGCLAIGRIGLTLTTRECRELAGFILTTMEQRGVEIAVNRIRRDRLWYAGLLASIVVTVWAWMVTR